MRGGESFHTIVEHLSFPLVVVRASGEAILYANPATEAAFGLAPGALLDLSLSELFLDPRQFHGLLTALARRGHLGPREALMRRADGTSVAMSIALESLFYDDEPAIVATFHDLTELRRMEGDLKVIAQVERLLSAVSTRFAGLGPEDVEMGLSHALHEIAELTLADSGFIALLDSESKVLRRLLRWRSDQVPAEPPPVWEALIEEHRDGLLDAVRGRRILFLTSDDASPWTALGDGADFSLAVAPIHYAGALRGLLGLGSGRPGKRWDRSEETLRTVAQIFANVLQRCDVEEALAAERELVALEREKANKLEAVGLLAGGIAHDFRNILLVLQGNASLARYSLDDPPKLERILRQIETAGGRARDLTEQLLTFSKGGAPVKALISIAELLCESARFCFRGSKVICEPQAAGDLWEVEADAGQINQVLNNLLINANQAMPGGGRIELTAENVPAERAVLEGLEGDHVLVRVSDDGPGMAPEVLAKIFDPYFTTKDEGSGLGLASAHSIVKHHDGQLRVESQLGRGTTFRLYLPATGRTASGAAGPEEELRQGVGRVLVVDDEADVRELATGMLQRLGYTPETAVDGAEAVVKYREALEEGKPFDVVLMDLTIPGGIGGADAVLRLRAMHPEARVIVSSGYSHDPVMAEYRQHGFDDVLPKPFVITRLGEVLHRVLQAPR